MSLNRLWYGVLPRLLGSPHLGSHCKFHPHVRQLITFTKQGLKPLTITEMRNRMEELTGAQKLWNLTGEKNDRSQLTSLLARDQSDLEPRKMADSYDEVMIPLSDPQYREKYINMYNGIRIGRILEDIDMFGVWLCYLHTKPSRDMKVSPLVIVTGLVDRIDLCSNDIQPDRDLRLSGHVTWVGKTSIEVTMNLEQIKGDNSYDKILEAKIVNVSRDPHNKSAAFVNPLLAETPEERDEMEAGNNRKRDRQERDQVSLLKSAPTADERQLIHRIFVESLRSRSTFSQRVKPHDAVWMEDTKLKNVIICFPQERNLYNKIFGGFLMRQALELSFANAILHCHCRIYMKAIDDILFRKPVEVGSFLFFLSEIAYTEGCFMQIRVHAEVVNPVTGQRNTTNVFHFTIAADQPVMQVWPKTYGESMLYLDGRRRFLEYKQINGVTDTAKPNLD